MPPPAPHRASRSRGARGVQHPPETQPSALDVLSNRPFLLLWLAQVATQVGGNMVIYGLTVLITATYGSATATSFLLLSFLVPAVVFSAPAGVLVDQVDKRLMLVVTNVLRGVAFLAIFFVGGNLLPLYLLVIFVATTTTFFGPAEASMIPTVVPRAQLLAANSFYTLTMNAAFAVGFALFGPFLVVLTGPQGLILVVAALYFVAAAFCWTLPAAPPSTEGGAVSAGQAVADAEAAVRSNIGELVDGIRYIREHPTIGWSLSYLGITGALIGVLGVLGPKFAQNALGLAPKDFVVIVLPLGLGIVTGMLALNTFGRYFPRRRVIEGGMIALGVLLVALSVSGPISRFLERRASATGLQDVSGLASLLSIVVGIAFLAGVSYAIVAVASQTQLQEDLPEDVRGRVFGVLNMLVSIASLLPIVVLGPVGDLVGTTGVIFVCAILVGAWGFASVVRRGPLRPLEHAAHALAAAGSSPVDPVTTMATGDIGHGHQIGGPRHAPVARVPVATKPGPAKPGAAKPGAAEPGPDLTSGSLWSTIGGTADETLEEAHAPSEDSAATGRIAAGRQVVAAGQGAAAGDDPEPAVTDAQPPPGGAKSQAASAADPQEQASGTPTGAPAPGPDSPSKAWRIPHLRHRPRGVVRTTIVDGPSGHSLGEELRRIRETFRRHDDERGQ